MSALSKRKGLLKFFLVMAIVMATVSCACASALLEPNVVPQTKETCDSANSRGDTQLAASTEYSAFCGPAAQRDEHLKRFSSACSVPQSQAASLLSFTGSIAQCAQAEHARVTFVCVSATHRRE